MPPKLGSRSLWKRLVVSRFPMKLLVPALLMALLSGCATKNVSYWSETKDGQGPAQIPNTQDPEFFSRLRVIEFDEQGDYWNIKQLRATRDMIDECKKPPLVVTYIHGWQNNGKPTNGDLNSFNEFLKKLQKTAIGRKKDICGVFIAWRGEGVEPFIPQLNVPRYLTFWSRKSATERIAGIPLSRTLTVICQDAHKQGGTAILTGHSFGGRVLERTFGQWLAVEGSLNKKFESIADLVVLINPASESLYAYQLKQALGNRAPSERPVIVSITSKSDGATKGIWALAARARTLTKGRGEFRPYYRGREKMKEDQYTYVNQTAGHDNRQYTHLLKKAPITAPGHPGSALSWNITKATKEFFYISGPGENDLQGYKLVPVNTVEGAYQTVNGGYWIFQVPDHILHDHGGYPDMGGIFNSQMVDLLGAVMKISNPQNSSRPPSVSLAPADKPAGIGQ